MKILETVGVRKWFGKLKAVDGVSISLDRENIIGLIGPNGSGKSTLFNIISGLQRPDAGEIFFDGQFISNLSPSKIFEKGLVKTFQIPSLFFNMTLLENLMIPPKNQLGERARFAAFRSKWLQQEMALAKKAKESIDFLQLSRIYHDLSKNCSGGQMKLCEIGRALMGDPKLVLLDEPTAGVAPNLAHDIMMQIVKLRESFKNTFFIIEHRLEIFLKYVDYVYVMHQGRIIKEGKVEEVLNDSVVKDVYLGD